MFGNLTISDNHSSEEELAYLRELNKRLVEQARRDADMHERTKTALIEQIDSNKGFLEYMEQKWPQYRRAYNRIQERNK